MDSSENNSDDYSSDESSSEESNNDACYSLSSINKRTHEEDGDYSYKRPRPEELELIGPSTSGIESIYNVESSTLHGHQDNYSSDESSYEDSNDEGLELIKPSTSGLKSKLYNVEKSAPKNILHGFIYQLRLLMLFVQRVPDGQEFYLSTEMHEAGLFNDIVLQYREKDGIWRYRFLQAKRKINDNDKIKISHLFKSERSQPTQNTEKLFNKEAKSKKKSPLLKNTGKKSYLSKNAGKGSQLSKHIGKDDPYLLKKYFNSYCTIKQDTEFRSASLEEFLICTNVGFSEEAMTYFERVEENDDDPILLNFEDINEKGLEPVKYRLTKKEKEISELKKEFEISDRNESCFQNFVEKFRFLPNYGDDKLNKNIQHCLKKCFKLENVDLAEADVQKRVLDWFQSYKKKKSKYFRFKDKKHFLKSLNTNIDSLLVAGYSTFYSEELKSSGVTFRNILPLREFFIHKKNKIISIITATPKLSVIKLSQLFHDLELKQDEFILTEADKLRSNKKISTTFFAGPSYKWLVLEYHHNEIKLGEMMNKILKMKKKKTIVIIGREDHVLNFRLCLPFDTPCLYDKNNAFKDLTITSQKKVLERQVIFQGEEVNLNELIDIYSGRKIIDEQTLEKLLTDAIKIGNNDTFISHFLIEEYYVQRKLIQKELTLNILQNEEVLERCLFFIPDVHRDQLNDLNINNKWIFVWEDGKTFNNGIIISPIIESRDIIFNELCKNNSVNTCWLEYIRGKFLIRNISNDTDILREHNICLEEHDLHNKQILQKKIIIVADGPGCGKSIFMTRIARQLKQRIPNRWVMRINLSYYAYKQKEQRDVKLLKDIQFKENETDRAIQFMGDLLFPEEYKNQNKHFVRKLFTHSLDRLNENMKCLKIILLFDGFDEINSAFQEKTLTLLQALQNTNVAQMWITTRNQEELRLEEALNSSSFFLNPLSFTEKVDFLQKLWKYNLVNFNNINPKPDGEDVLSYLEEITNNICNYSDKAISTSFQEFQNDCLPTLSSSKLQHLLSNVDFSDIAEHVINYFENCYKNKISQFTANPLQLRMAGEIIVYKKFNSLDKLDIFSLYEEFIKYKWTLFRDDKDAAGKSEAGHDCFKIVLKHLTSNHQKIAFKSLFRPHDTDEFVEGCDKIFLSRAGLLVIHNDRLEFVHRSFEEYFASQYFAKYFKRRQIQEIVFSKILIEDNYSLIREFLNSNTKFLDKLSSKTPQMIKVITINSSDSKILYQMLQENLNNLFVKFLEDLPIDFAKKAILFKKNVDGTTVLHRICNFITDEQIENILKALKDTVSSEKLIELSFNKDNERQTAMHCIYFYKRNSIVKQKLQFFKLNCDSKVFYELSLEFDERGKTMLHIDCEHKKDVNYLLEVSNENGDAIRKILLKTDEDWQTALYNTILVLDNPSLLTILLKLVKLICNSSEIENLFAIKNDSRNLLHNACYQPNKDILDSFLNAIKDNKEIVENLLLEIDEDELSPLHYTVRNFYNFDRLKILLDFVNSNCSPEMLHMLVCKRTRFGTTILHMAVEHFKVTDGHDSLTPLLNYLFNLLKDNKEIFYTLLMIRDEKQRTILDYTSSEQEYAFLLDFIKLNCDEKILTNLSNIVKDNS